MNIKIGKYHKISILVGSALFIIGASYFSFTYFLSGVKNMHSAITLHIAKQEAREKRLGALEAFREQYDKIKGSNEAFNLTVEDDEKVQLIELVEMMAENTGNTIVISVDETTSAETKKKTTSGSEVSNVPSGFQPLNFDITLEGSYESFIVFLHKIENMKDFALVSEIQVVRKSEEEEVATVERKNVFVQKTPLALDENGDEEESTDTEVEAVKSVQVVSKTPKVVMKNMIESQIKVVFFMPKEKESAVDKKENDPEKGTAADATGTGVEDKDKDKDGEGGNSITVPEDVNENND